ncbi:MAG TPA: secretion system protein, partial [Thermoprotei archaeon]|nr:secretion system protein [Thermoprotei archaeon]
MNYIGNRVTRMKFWDFIYKYFWWFGKAILKLYPNIPESVRRSGMSIYPEAYASFIGFITILSAIISIILSIIIIYFQIFPLILSIIVILPFLTLVFMTHLPYLIGSGRAGALDGEIPYTTAYLSIMVASGVSPYGAFERISRARKVFPRSSDLSQRFILLVRVLGRDPLTAFSILASRTPSATVKDLLTGYISTVRSGGDVIDYLTKKARIMFSEILVKMKIIADRLGSLLEAYLALILLTTISLSTLYFINVAIAAVALPALSGLSMFLLLYVLLPFLSIMIMYISDLVQYKEPWIDYRPYIVFFGITIPVTIFIIVFGLYLPSVLPKYHPFSQNPITLSIINVVNSIASLTNIPDYLYSSLMVTFALFVATLPSAIYTLFISREYKIVYGITKFLRDLVEIRKTGLSPERSVIELAQNNYGVFSKHLKRVAMQLSLGISLSRIISGLFKKIIVWRARVLLYMLTDAIEVGGGTIENLENLAWFAENVDAIEEEKKKSLRTLLIVPYVGAIIVIITIILLASFLGSLVI